MVAELCSVAVTIFIDLHLESFGSVVKQVELHLAHFFPGNQVSWHRSICLVYTGRLTSGGVRFLA